MPATLSVSKDARKFPSLNTYKLQPSIKASSDKVLDFPSKVFIPQGFEFVANARIRMDPNAEPAIGLVEIVRELPNNEKWQRVTPFKVIQGGGQAALLFVLKRLSDGKEFVLRIVKLPPVKSLEACRLKAGLHNILSELLTTKFCSTGAPYQKVVCTYTFPNEKDETFLACITEKYSKSLWNSYPEQFKEHKLKSIMAQLLVGLEFMHQYKIAHADFTGSNVMVDILPDGTIRVHIIDFGYARATNATVVGSETTCIGTREFNPPELLNAYECDPQQATHIDMSKVDIFSAGLILLFLFLGDATWWYTGRQCTQCYSVYLSGEPKCTKPYCASNQPTLRRVHWVNPTTGITEYYDQCTLCHQLHSSGCTSRCANVHCTVNQPLKGFAKTNEQLRRTLDETLKALEERSGPYATMSAELRDVLIAMLSREPANRPTAAQLLADPWFAEVKDVIAATREQWCPDSNVVNLRNDLEDAMSSTASSTMSVGALWEKIQKYAPLLSGTDAVVREVLFADNEPSRADKSSLKLAEGDEEAGKKLRC